MTKIKKILIATDSFKGSCSAINVTKQIEAGLKSIHPDLKVIKLPVADGGEGTVDALLFATCGLRKTVEVAGPLGKKVFADFGILPNGTAVIEMAAASGLPLLAASLQNPWRTTTYGTGELLKAALDLGCKNIILGIGGSATNDGGAGMAMALGAGLLDKNGIEIPLGGGGLTKLSSIDLSGFDPRIADCEITVACDVNNPLCGKKGASYIYGPQKGATPEMVEKLDEALAHYAKILQSDLKKDIKNCPGSGAAGGLGAGLLAFCNAQIKSGIHGVLDLLEFDQRMEGVDLVITGEGAIDEQTLFGKVPSGVAKRAKAVIPTVPVIAIAGTLGKNYAKAYTCGIDFMFSLANGPISLEDSMKKAPQLLKEAGASIGHLINLIG